MFRILLLVLAIIMTPLGVTHAESNNKTVWENMNPSKSTEDDVTNTQEIAVSNEIGFGETIKIFGSLILVIGLILLAFYFIKKSKANNFNQNQLFESLGGFSLGNQRSLQVIRMNGRIFILGVSDTIQLIKEVEDPQEVREIIHKQSSTPENLFGAKFQKQLELIKSGKKETISKLLRKEQEDD